MKLTQSRSRIRGGQHVDGPLVEVTETIELNEQEMERVVNKLAEGDFFTTASDAAVWERLKDIGTLVEYEERAENYTITEKRQ